MVGAAQCFLSIPGLSMDGMMVAVTSICDLTHKSLAWGHLQAGSEYAKSFPKLRGARSDSNHSRL